MTVEIYVDAKGEYRWRLKSRNGKVVADSGEGYNEKRKAKQAWTRLVYAMDEKPVSVVDIT